MHLGHLPPLAFIEGTVGAAHHGRLPGSQHQGHLRGAAVLQALGVTSLLVRWQIRHFHLNQRHFFGFFLAAGLGLAAALAFASPVFLIDWALASLSRVALRVFCSESRFR